MFERVLLATDGSSHAEEALKHARDLASRDGAQVIVVHAFAAVPSYLGEPWEDRAMARHVAAGHQVANEAAQRSREAGLEVNVEVLHAAVCHPQHDRCLQLLGNDCLLRISANSWTGSLNADPSWS